MLRTLHVEAFEVRQAADLLKADALIIPGGESTTILRLLKAGNLVGPLADFAKDHPIFGTCAGLILMAGEVLAEEPGVKPFGWMEVAVERNAFGRQTESFRADLELQLEGKTGSSFPAFFIRAPRIRK